ncbi:hypothetical protein ACFR97_05430 [Haloplanus litoreus]|uniref:Uncharacterized protein n=1 Tax=Haloplanus litoreus TaxID=767515 RepID=A0ABD6A0P4_9EURY
MTFGRDPRDHTLSKGLTGAYQPLGGITVTADTAEHFKGTALRHGHTDADAVTVCLDVSDATMDG